jgi:PTH1 family peptidyl-tRNA hydrolase
VSSAKSKSERNPRRNSLPALVLGLGNPGAVYAGTRHNVGFQALDLRAHRRKLRFRRPLFRNYELTVDHGEHGDLVLVKPLTYMNDSGRVLPTLLRRFRPERTVVICDNLDLSPGVLRMKRGGSGGGHRGLASIAAYLRPEEYLRLYIGIGRPGGLPSGKDAGSPEYPDGGDAPDHATAGSRRAHIVEYVLTAPDDTQRPALEEGVRRAADAIDLVPGTPVNELIQRINANS